MCVFTRLTIHVALREGTDYLTGELCSALALFCILLQLGLLAYLNLLNHYRDYACFILVFMHRNPKPSSVYYE